MSLSFRIMSIGFLFVLLISSTCLASYFHGKYTAANRLAIKRWQMINDMQVRQRNVAALDAKYTKELADAQANIDQLQHDVASGRRRLQFNASCTKQSPTITTVMDDAASPRLTKSAEQDYFTLRKRIETSKKMIAGLQDFIKQQCQ